MNQNRIGRGRGQCVMVTTTKLCVNERGAVWNRRKTVREGRSGVLGHQGFRRGRGAGETDPGPGEINKVCGRATHRCDPPAGRWLYKYAVPLAGVSGLSDAPCPFPKRHSAFQYWRSGFSSNSHALPPLALVCAEHRGHGRGRTCNFRPRRWRAHPARHLPPV